ncbi:MAG: two-component system nitrogen regulation sensor histidine kinase GlnL [Methylophagaceae bacterium]|jgi:two-component system nitrogen regulation sensor histidine kinase GlnL
MTQTSYQTIVENLASAIVILDNNFKLRFINAAAEVLFDISQRQAELIPFQTILPGEDNLFLSLNTVQQTGQEILNREIKLFIPSTGEIIVDCAIKLLEENEEEQLILLQIFQLDHKHRISREESLHAQQQVMRGLAHEIKNPLGGLRGAAQLLERQLESDELKEYTGIIISEADRLQNLMANMLGSQQQSKKTQVNIHEVLQRVRQLVKIEVDERLVFQADYDPSIPELEVDLDHLVQIFLNLVRNAVQALNGVGKIILKTRIKRHATIDNKRYRIAAAIDIIDNGHGITTSLQESMFYPLVTGRPEGTGLGLYICQSLVHRNQGVISCISQPGHTVFSVVFPLEQASE